MGNSGSSAIVGKGSICIETNTCCRLVLDDVRHVPDIRLNLLSVGKLDDIKHPSYFGEGKWKLTKGSLIVARGSKQGNLYVTKTKLCNEVLNIAEKDTSIELWHKRLGHCHLQRMQAMKELTVGLPTFDDNFQICDACQSGKQRRRAFPTSSWKATRKLQLIHSDVAGPHRIESFAGSRYYVIFIDDFS